MELSGGTSTVWFLAHAEDGVFSKTILDKTWEIGKWSVKDGLYMCIHIFDWLNENN